MRAFVVMCFVALATADKLGYNYQPVAHSDSVLSFSPSSGLGGSSDSLGGLSGGNLGGSLGYQGGLGGSSGGLSSGLGGLGGGLSGGLSDFGGLGGGGGLGSVPSGNSGLSGSSGPSSSSTSVGAPRETEYEKEFYTFTANDSDFDEPQGNDQAVNSVKKNLRVIFIKGPENSGLENAALNLARHAGEQKTAIYVLQKQADLGDLANKLQASNDVQSHKPEVHFVKYRTPEDAVNAQKAIQSQYEQLDGPSQSHNGGAAPVHNFASPASPSAPSVGSNGISDGTAGGISGGVGSVGSGFGGVSPAAPSAKYLPAAILRALRI